ncbi:hypothetical protein BU26DRAFT_482907 [Trematosphaeria pertusa]|uniref:Uncharacterized protein n=1 Tax=Trematosphaeria pertusa TaxID=390896 RepID=A0A6A6IKJ3_9PLEO|nr:uncharacterized protein BU26DRAFT_482907 [Trematosphaeria pertusa]KAF2250080.1 hypothetical protein BU26DRAFT_482907 [Trematosphaeria pertusa]
MRLIKQVSSTRGTVVKDLFQSTRESKWSLLPAHLPVEHGNRHYQAPQDIAARKLRPLCPRKRPPFLILLPLPPANSPSAVMDPSAHAFWSPSRDPRGVAPRRGEFAAPRSTDLLDRFSIAGPYRSAHMDEGYGLRGRTARGREYTAPPSRDVMERFSSHGPSRWPVMNEIQASAPSVEGSIGERGSSVASSMTFGRASTPNGFALGGSARSPSTNAPVTMPPQRVWQDPQSPLHSMPANHAPPLRRQSTSTFSSSVARPQQRFGDLPATPPFSPDLPLARRRFPASPFSSPPQRNFATIATKGPSTRQSRVDFGDRNSEGSGRHTGSTISHRRGQEPPLSVV